MSKQLLIKNLIDQLLLIDKRMQVFEEPLPETVTENLILAVAGFGDEVLPYIHEAINKTKNEQQPLNLVAVLGIINHESSVATLIDLHANYSSDFMGVDTTRILAQIGTEEAYKYLLGVLETYLNGNKRIINSTVEITIICKALGQWKDLRALEILKRAISITSMNGMPKAAIEALLNYEDGVKFLASKTNNQ